MNKETRILFFTILGIVLGCLRLVSTCNKISPAPRVPESEIFTDSVIRQFKALDSIMKARKGINVSLGNFLEQPFDLHKFKSKKRGSNSSAMNLKKYQWRPDTPGFTYKFTAFELLEPVLFNETRWLKHWVGYSGKDTGKVVHSSGRGLYLVTYQPDNSHRHLYKNPTEKLIEIACDYNDFDLPEMAFVGLHSTEIRHRFGEPSFTKGTFVVYTQEGNTLLLKLDRYKKVTYWKYVRLKSPLTKGTDLPDIYNTKL